MADQFTKVTRQSWGSKLTNSLLGAVIGVVFFFGSFFVLWGNEGKINWSQVASTSTAVNASAGNRASEGAFIAATGNLATSEQLGDSAYLRPGSYLKLERRVEMFAWSEDERSETEKRIGGETVTKTTYEYKKEWTRSPENSKNFEYSQSHVNPEQSVKEAEWTASSAQIGTYSVELGNLELPEAKLIKLNGDIVLQNAGQKLVGEYIFIGKGTPEQPEIGDIRIQFAAVPNKAGVTVFGTQQGNAIVPYMYRGESSFFRALEGDRATAIAQLQAEHNMITWILRIAGFLMMWLGMCLVLGPITAFLDVLPMLGSASGWMIGLGTFVVALLLSAVTIVIAIIAHNLVALVALLLLLVGGAVFWSKRQARPAAVATT